MIRQLFPVEQVTQRHLKRPHL